VLQYSDPGMAWVGEEKFVPHVLRMMRRPAWHVTVKIGPPMRNTDAEALLEGVRTWMAARVNP
jgi:hypothetical protein